MAPRLGPAAGPRLRWSLPPLPWSKCPCGKVGMGMRKDPLKFRVPVHPSPKTRHRMVVTCGLTGPCPKLNHGAGTRGLAMRKKPPRLSNPCDMALIWDFASHPKGVRSLSLCPRRE